MPQLPPPSYLLFLTTPGAEPTNNLTERAIQLVAIHRRLGAIIAAWEQSSPPGSKWVVIADVIVRR